MNRENKSRYAVLGLISKRDMSGYDIKQLIKKISSFYWSESNAQIYPILKKLEAEGLVISKLDKKSGARKKMIYSITSKGLAVLKKWLTQPVELPQYREELLLKLNLGQHLPLDISIQHISEFRDQLHAQLKKLVTIEEHIEKDHKDRADYHYLLMTYNYSRLVIEAKLNWCEQTLKTLTKLSRVKTH